MRKSRIIAALLAIAVAFSLSACTQKPWDEDVVAFDPATFTNAQMLEDYDAFWSGVDENFALLNAFSEKYDENIEDMKAKYRTKIEILKDGDAEGFKAAMAYLTRMFHAVGHIAMISGGDYYPQMNNRDNANASTIRMYDNEKSKSFYKWYYNLPEMQAMIEADKKANGAAKGEEQTETDEQIAKRVEAGVIISEEKGIPKITIPSFNFRGKAREDAIKKIQQFCIDNLDSAEVIIDIRGNTGGFTPLWLDGFAPLYAGKKFEQIETGGYKNSENNQYNFDGWPENDKSVRFEKIEKNADGCDVLVTKTTQWDFTKSTEFGKNQFAGRAWLLVDENNYSAGDQFVQFANSTSFITTIGRRTNGNGSSIADDPYNYFMLPNSGMLIRYVSVCSYNADGTSGETHGTMPKIEIGNSEDALAVCLAEIAKGK